MFGLLNARTRAVIEELVRGSSVALGGKTIKPLEKDGRVLLQVLAENLPDIREERGTELGRKVRELFVATPENVLPSAIRESNARPRPPKWRLFELRASSYRGLGPAGTIWTFDFSGRSHLFYGQNGCGKTSFLGAIVWCLTGRILRDDQGPSPPETITVYTTAPKAKVAGTRPDGLTLTDHAGSSTPHDGAYWVELRFVNEEASSAPLWIRRHSSDGLTRSDDGSNWTSISSLEDVGISETDAELQLLMPARIPYIRFGKDADLVPLFAQVVGLDDLEEIAEVANKTHAAAVREANRLEKSDLPRVIAQIAECAERIASLAPDVVRNLDGFSQATSPDRDFEAVKLFGEQVNQQIAADKAQLAKDLEIELPEGGALPTQALNNLPGQVQMATEELCKGISLAFKQSVGLKLPQTEEVAALAANLQAFERDARRVTSERLEWARRSAENRKLGLLLKAAEFFPEGAENCPICDRSLGEASDVRQSLVELRANVKSLHLQQAIEDLERELLHNLNAILAANARMLAGQELSDRIRVDWHKLKEARFPGLLRGVAERFDASVEEVAAGVERATDQLIPSFGEGFDDILPSAFQAIENELNDAYRYVEFVKNFYACRDKAIQLLEACLTAEALSSASDSLLLVLRRGKEINDRLRSLDLIVANARELCTAEEKRSAISVEISTLRRIARSADPIKELAGVVRQEVINVVKGVEPRVKLHYQQLYGDDRLVLDMVTTGHAANPNVKNELNVYLRTGSERIPIAPYANAGRFRALVLSFVFAILEKSSGTLGLLVLDDQASSLDDDHKARFVDHLVGPCLAKFQVVLASHYERFYKDAEPVFSNAERLQLVPRRSDVDAVAFEPADLLSRIETATRERTCTWRECGLNLRRWGERVLQTISAYCPDPFIRFNDIPGSVDNYAAMIDPRIATERRKTIVDALRSPAFERIMHRVAHDEEVTESDVTDGLQCLKACRKHAEAEINRLKQIFYHELVGRAIERRPCLVTLPPKVVFSAMQLQIEGAAAAASNGVGVTWHDQEKGDLEGYGVALTTADVIAPVALVGQILLLDPDDDAPGDEDLAVVETEEGKCYVRRVWMDDGEIHLEGVNPTSLFAPVRIRRGRWSARRIVGVLYESAMSVKSGGPGNEWVHAGGVPHKALKDVMGIRVKGTSMEPVARNGQVVVVRRQDVKTNVSRGSLACVDIHETGAVIKRCYPGPKEWTLYPVNAVEIEDPIRVKAENILHVYPLVGVFFRLASVGSAAAI